MEKYNFELDMESENSNSVIIRNIKPNSRVLEIGCAYGRMTKYLNNELNCDVDIVEIDIESGTKAAAYSYSSFLGEDIGDILSFNCYRCFSNRIYDFVILADVLEHLSDPALALTRARSVLDDNGKILISVPNISHNSVIIDLMHGKFNYRDVGLLDNTHIKFFTESSLEKLILSCGLKIEKTQNLINAVENTEFNNSYEDVPKEVADYLKSRTSGEVYQFVWTLTK